MIGSYNFNNTSIEELQHLLGAGEFGKGTMASLARGKLAGLQAAAKRQPPAAASPGIAAAAVDLSKQNAELEAASAKWVEGQNANIERQGERSLAQGMSNMIGSGLAGTTAVGGMTAGVGESVTRAKGDVAGQAAQQLAGQKLQYAGMAQGANESALNRSFQASENALNRSHSERMAATSGSYSGAGRSAPIPAGLDAFGQPMRGSMQAAQLSAFNQSKRQTQGNPTNAPIGGYGQAPSLFSFS